MDWLGGSARDLGAGVAGSSFIFCVYCFVNSCGSDAVFGVSMTSNADQV